MATDPLFERNAQPVPAAAQPRPSQPADTETTKRVVIGGEPRSWRVTVSRFVLALGILSALIALAITLLGLPIKQVNKVARENLASPTIAQRAAVMANAEAFVAQQANIDAAAVKPAVIDVQFDRFVCTGREGEPRETTLRARGQLGDTVHMYIYAPMKSVRERWDTNKRPEPPWSKGIKLKREIRPGVWGPDEYVEYVGDIAAVKASPAKPEWTLMAVPGVSAESTFRAYIPETLPAGYRLVVKVQREVPPGQSFWGWVVVRILAVDLQTLQPEPGDFKPYK